MHSWRDPSAIIQSLFLTLAGDENISITKSGIEKNNNEWHQRQNQTINVIWLNKETDPCWRVIWERQREGTVQEKDNVTCASRDGLEKVCMNACEDVKQRCWRHHNSYCTSVNIRVCALFWIISTYNWMHNKTIIK